MRVINLMKTMNTDEVQEMVKDQEFRPHLINLVQDLSVQTHLLKGQYDDPEAAADYYSKLLIDKFHAAGITSDSDQYHEVIDQLTFGFKILKEILLHGDEGIIDSNIDKNYVFKYANKLISAFYIN